jgi:hypothetical protein
MLRAMISTHLRSLCLSAIVVSCPVVVGACIYNTYDDDGDGDGADAADSTETGAPSFDNQAACEAWVGAYNQLECTSGAQLDPATTCSGYTDTTVDCSVVFDCWTDNMMCEDLGGVMVINNYPEGCPTSCV